MTGSAPSQPCSLPSVGSGSRAVFHRRSSRRQETHAPIDKICGTGLDGGGCRCASVIFPDTIVHTDWGIIREHRDSRFVRLLCAEVLSWGLVTEATGRAWPCKFCHALQCFGILVLNVLCQRTEGFKQHKGIASARTRLPSISLGDPLFLTWMAGLIAKLNKPK